MSTYWPKGLEVGAKRRVKARASIEREMKKMGAALDKFDKELKSGGRKKKGRA